MFGRNEDNMTKKDYEMIANRISLKHFQAESLENYHESVKEFATAKAWGRARTSLLELAHDLTLDLQIDNPKFDSDKFIKACTRPRPHE